MKKGIIFITLLLISIVGVAQNSLVKDGFGGRLWYKSYNYTVGSYSAYTVCGTNKQLYGWGSNRASQLGNVNAGFDSKIPVPAINMNNVKYYSTGYMMGAIKEDNSGWVWGFTNYEPVKVIDDVFFVDAGAGSCAFVKNDGTVWSVGNCQRGEFGSGDSSFAFSNIPIKMKNMSNVVRTAVGMHATAVLKTDGTVWCAGMGERLGNGIGGIELLPVKTIGLVDIIDIKANSKAIIALDKNGDVWSWGDSSLGLGSVIKKTNIPIKISNLSNIVAISGCNDGLHFLALDENKNCYGWGVNLGNCLGIGSSIPEIETPKLLTKDVVEIMAGELFSYIIKTDGKLYACGGGDIWMDIIYPLELGFQEIKPESEIMNLCKPVNHNEISYLPYDNALFFPNAFTPNGDDKNELFKALLKPGVIIEKFQMKIFSRWGELMFQTSDINKGWDGNYKNQPQEIGTYFYHAQYNTPNRKSLTLKGDITLLR